MPRRVGWGAAGILVAMCAIWGCNIVFIKISSRGIPPLVAVTLRNCGAALLVGGYLLLRRRVALLHRDRRLVHGLVIGVLFAFDFLFLYWGATLTDASRAVILLYTQPIWVALGAHFFLPDDRLTARKGAGLLLAFTGVAAVMLSKSGQPGTEHLVGDIMEVGAALSWAATTLYIKATLGTEEMSSAHVLFYQLAFSVPLLATAALLFDRDATFDPTPVVVGSLLFQTLVVATASYAVWYWMLQRYSATAISSFTLLTPLFGVLAGWLILGEALPVTLLLGLVCVVGGIYLVQTTRPRADASAGSVAS